MWQADQRHGPGVMVTQAGVCYQGTFQADKMVVSGVTRVYPEPPFPCTGAEPPALRVRMLSRGWAALDGAEAGFLGARGRQNLSRILPATYPGLGRVPAPPVSVSPSAPQVNYLL